MGTFQKILEIFKTYQGILSAALKLLKEGLTVKSLIDQHLVKIRTPFRCPSSSLKILVYSARKGMEISA